MGVVALCLDRPSASSFSTLRPLDQWSSYSRCRRIEYQEQSELAETCAFKCLRCTLLVTYAQHFVIESSELVTRFLHKREQICTYLAAQVLIYSLRACCHVFFGSPIDTSLQILPLGRLVDVDSFAFKCGCGGIESWGLKGPFS